MAKQQRHEYYVDVNEILSIFEGCIKLIKGCPRNMTDYHTKVPDLSSILEPNQSAFNNSEYRDRVEFDSRRTKHQVSGGDQETLNLINYIENCTGVGVNNFLNMRSAQYRSYQIEDESVLTEVFFRRNCDLICLQVS